MLKIGSVSIDVSHPKAFATIMEERCMDMRYIYTCKESFRTQEEAEWFAKRFGMKGVVEKVEDMVDEVDIGFIQSCNWEKHLEQAMPFIEKGKPVFIDKPMVGTVRDAKKVRELIKNGAKIIGSSSIRHCKEIRNFLAIPVEQRGEVVSIFGVCGANEFDYAIHVVGSLSELAQSKAVSNRYVGCGVGPNGEKCEMFTVAYENGVAATYCTYLSGWRSGSITVVTTKGVYNFIAITDCYENLLCEIYHEMVDGKSRLVDVETILNCCETLIAGKKSRDQRNGAEVKITDLEDDDKFDGYAFEEKYAQNADRTLYKD